MIIYAVCRIKAFSLRPFYEHKLKQHCYRLLFVLTATFLILFTASAGAGIVSANLFRSGFLYGRVRTCVFSVGLHYLFTLKRFFYPYLDGKDKSLQYPHG